MTVQPVTVTVAGVSVTVNATINVGSGGAALGVWSGVEPGSTAGYPTFTPNQSVYPNAQGVQFWFNGQIDVRAPASRPNGYDATGPNEGSTYHMYPDLVLVAGDVLEARWVDGSGTARTSTHTVVGEAGTSPPPGECTFTNPNDPADDPNPLLDSSGYGRDPVSTLRPPAGYPTPLTTGLCGAGVSVSSLTPASGMTITKHGTILDGLDFSGGVLHVKANNVTIRNCRFTSGGSSYVIRNYGGFTGLTIENCRIRGIGTVTTLALGEFATLRRVHMTGGKILISATRGFLIEDSYMTGWYRQPGSHNDIIWVDQGSNYTLRRNSLIGGWQRGTAALFFHAKHTGGPIDNVLVENNYISGGGYTVYTTAPDFPLTNARIVNNVLERNSWKFGPFNNTAAGTVISGNVDQTGVPVT